jgi:hypothetical protein
MARRLAPLLSPLLLLLLATEPALAYIGPAPTLTVIGTILAVLGMIVLAIFGFIWYPIKRLRAKFRQSGPSEPAPREQDAEKGDNTRIEPAQK